jgi:hypothetical protein
VNETEKKEDGEPAKQEIVKRNPDGTWPPGQSGNPVGSNGTARGYQKGATRMRHYLNMSAKEVRDLSASASLEELPMADVLVITTLAAATKPTKDGLKNRQEAFDRADGKATQIIGGDPENPFTSPLPEKFPSVEEAAAVYLAETKSRPE